MERTYFTSRGLPSWKTKAALGCLYLSKVYCLYDDTGQVPRAGLVIDIALWPGLECLKVLKVIFRCCFGECFDRVTWFGSKL